MPFHAELLGVFLEEAGEVLETIGKTLPVCREHPEDEAQQRRDRTQRLWRTGLRRCVERRH